MMWCDGRDVVTVMKRLRWNGCDVVMSVMTMEVMTAVRYDDDAMTDVR
jgi:hypothetical protein